MRRVPPVLVAALLWACGDDASDADGLGDVTGTPMTSAGPTTTATGDDTGSSSGGGGDTGSTSPGSSGSSGSGSDGSSGSSTGEAVAPTCADLEDAPPTNMGCSFYGVDLPTLFVDLLPLGFGVVNPHPLPTTVVIEDRRGAGGSLREVVSVELEPTEARAIKVNGLNGVLTGIDHSVSELGLTTNAAFHVRSDRPIAVTQFGPMEGSQAGNSDGSLLLPERALGLDHVAIGHTHLYEEFILDDGSYIVVVGVTDGTTVVTPQGTVTLDAYDAHFFANGRDATGFTVTADTPVAVFSGSSCAIVGGSGCDHIEEQLVPVDTWGTEAVTMRHPRRVPEYNPDPEFVHYRVLAGAPGITVTLAPPPATGGTIALAAKGDFAGFSADQDFVATADGPFLLVQYMSGSGSVTLPPGELAWATELSGDPYMIQIPPREQWTDEVVIITDMSYRHDVLLIAREAGTAVHVGCLGNVPDDHFVAVSGSIYEIGTIDVDTTGYGGEGNCFDGAQTISADGPIGVAVVGVDTGVAYGYAAATGLASLNAAD